MYCAVKELFKNTDLRKSLVLNARKKAETFDWEHVKQKWVEILK
jgi:glycosyltransferase involved in cell wall biosynthesis